jgi:hypothetical protein
MKPENHKQITDFIARHGGEFTADDYSAMDTADKCAAILAVDHMYAVLLGGRLTDLARRHRREDLYELIEELWHKEK